MKVQGSILTNVVMVGSTTLFVVDMPAADGADDVQALEKGTDSDMEVSYAKVIECTTKFKEEGEKLFQK